MSRKHRIFKVNEASTGGSKSPDCALTKKELTDLLYEGLKNRLPPPLLYEGLKSRLPPPKQTFCQNFWNSLRSVFQKLASFCESMQRTSKKKSEEQILAEKMVEILQKNASENGMLFAGIGHTDEYENAEELDKLWRPALKMYGPSPSEMPEEVMTTKPRMPLFASEHEADYMMENVSNARLRHLLRKDKLTPGDEAELSDLTKNKDIILME